MEIVSFEIAKKLKEKGFREKVNAYYGKHENIFDVHPALDMNDADYRASAPTISQVLKWLRENHKLHISTKPYPCEDGVMWEYEVRKFSSVLVCVVVNKTGFKEPELAALAGVEYCLDNLI